MTLCPRSILACVIATAAMLAGCAPAPAYPGRLDAWERASLTRTEKRLESSAQRIRDPILQAYVDSVAGSLEPDRPSTDRLRIYLMDRPGRQADLLGGQVLRFNLGLLLALQSEAELAFVLAHELAHRDLQHDEARRRTGWDALAAEVQADLAATSILAGLGYGSSTGKRLLVRLLQQSTDTGAREQLSRRVAAITTSSRTGDITHDDGKARFERIVAPYRARQSEKTD